MNKIPEPASPLPWFPAEDKPVRPYLVGSTSPNQAQRREHCITRGNPSGGGPFHAAMENHKYQQDRDYILWAANNARALYDLAALVERLDPDEGLSPAALRSLHRMATRAVKNANKRG